MLGISMIFNVLSETPQAEARQSGEGKKDCSQGTLLQTVWGIQHTECNIQHGTWNIEAERDVNVGLYHTLHSLVAPGKQGPADDGKRWHSDGRCILRPVGFYFDI